LIFGDWLNPYLDKWLSDQFSPLKIKDFILENKDDLMLKASEMPGFIYEALDEIRGYSKNKRSYEEKIHKMEMQLQKEKYIIRFIGIGIITLCGIFLMLT
jgi:hypothetical protein